MHIIAITPMAKEDWPDVQAIYQEGLDTKNASFQETAPSWEEWHADHLCCCRLVAKTEGKVVGWAALSPISKRSVYRGVAEVSIYVSSQFKGEGFGDHLLKSLIESSRENGLWTLQASIFPENKPSVYVHKKNGFRKVGRRERIGQQDGIWRDTLLFELRSNQTADREGAQ